MSRKRAAKVDFPQPRAFVGRTWGMKSWMGASLGFVLWALGVLGCTGHAPLPPRAVTLNHAGVQALGDGHLALAEARFALALEYHPRFVDAMVNLALVEMERGNFDLAARQLDEAVDINRHLAQPHHGLGVLAERKERWAEAAEHYREALRVDPGFVPSRANLARLYFESGQLDHAREQFLRLVQVAPEQPEAWAGLADSLYRLGREEQAEAVVAEAAQLHADAPEVRIHLARIAMRRGRLGDARSLLLPVARSEARAARDAWAWLGLVHLLRDDETGAIRCAEQALEQERNHPLATYVLGMGLARRGNPDAASWLSRARKLSPGNSVIADALERSRGSTR